MGNFAGVGYGGIMWRNGVNLAVWIMNGATITSAVSLGTLPLNWSVAGVGDFNGDGYSDLLFTDTTGDIAIWFMKGTQVISALPVATIPTQWSVRRHRRFQR